MTQQIDPRLLGLPRAPIAPAVPDAQTQPAAVAPAAPAPASVPAGVAYWNQTGAERDADPEVDPQQLEALREKHSGFETAATQFARGALDALLAPGALVGLTAETGGELLKNKALRDFGRDVGKASSGRAAAETLGFIFGGGAENIARSAVGQEVDFEEQREALRASEHAVQTIDEQDEARPTLAMVSKVAGMAALAIGMGAASTGEAALATTIGANTAEGAAGGAQAAYEKSAPLRDVLSAAAVGGILSAGITGAAEGVGHLAKKTPDLAKVFGERVQEFADSRAVKSVIGRDPQAWRAMTANGTDTSRLARVAERIRAADIIGKGDDGMLEALEKGVSQATDDLRKVATHLDESGIAPDVKRLFSSWDEQVAKLRSSGSGTQQNIADALEREIRPFRDKLLVGTGELSPDTIRTSALERIGALRAGATNPVQAAENEAVAKGVEKILKRLDGVDLQGGARSLAPEELLGVRRQLRKALGDETFAEQSLAPVYRDPTFTELRELRTALGNATKWHRSSQSMATEEMQRLYHATSRELGTAADLAGPQYATLWKQSNEAAADFIEMSDALGREIARKAKNRFVSPSDYGTGIASALATAVMGGNPISAIAAGAATALGHRAIREGGSAAISSLANRFARMTRGYAAAAKGAGGEAKQVLELVARTKAFMSETAQRAGDNPALRQAAEETARRVAADHMAKIAGEFDPATWATRKLSGVQKVVYRTQVLDSVAQDLATAAKRVDELRPAMPHALNPKLVARYTRNAKGPEAIGAVQQALGQIAESAPPTATGDAAGVALREAMIALDRSDVPETMTRAHALVGWLDQAADHAEDEASKHFVERASQAIRDRLSSEAFGDAGQLYRELSRSPHEAWKAIQQADQLRESLRKYGQVGHLPAIAQQESADLLKSYAARAKLSGITQPPEVSQAAKEINRLFRTAENAVTLDGKPMGSLVEAAELGSAEGAAKAVSETTVADALNPELDRVLAALKGEPVKVGADTFASDAAFEQLLPDAPRASTVGRIGGAALNRLNTPQERRQLYDQRIQQLGRTVADPGTLADAGNLHPTIAADASTRLQNLLRDMPKPTPSIRGKAFETMSSEDLRLANSMWEATTAPLSVFSDFASGSVDYDKVQYAWKQYPGLQQAAQAGVMDMLSSELSDKERERLPEATLTQLDYLLGFQGALQPTVKHDFGQRMSALYQPQPNKPQPGGMLESPAAEPTFTQRLAGAS